MTVASPVESSDVVVPIQSRRRERVLLFQQAQHAVPALFLFPDGLQRLAGEPHGLALALAIGEIVTSLLVVASIARAQGGAARREGTTSARPRRAVRVA